jgi:hypothetical protein
MMMSQQSRDALRVGISGLVGLALDAELPRAAIAHELRQAAEMLCPSRSIRYSITEEPMSIDAADDEPRGGEGLNP